MKGVSEAGEAERNGTDLGGGGDAFVIRVVDVEVRSIVTRKDNLVELSFSVVTSAKRPGESRTGLMRFRRWWMSSLPVRGSLEKTRMGSPKRTSSQRRRTLVKERISWNATESGVRGINAGICERARSVL